ncbi:hypothetical protein LTR10_020903 [Elasticomyces elasticus]|uniref:Cupin type-2 domain-containing protein n=1 Tax=Exophiala sideris TaxID=1016849 RepID=A0ABR0J005_9EURO|nr:hypothetical protein LTR10_020903 [Elasticomyces elasticus]KAK5023385.1 hypothetical protein LTS07_009260 [Exophiala sideris]KAK5028240.1 hypothetical protein LTR13_009228 [Exophiala sideris]KAK5052898.1 hypothetical protein LTR69_009724 [Exophiala sideris]KAK5178509.1 hypothetical protein LTR44_009134 [Eurotiomycetes sp. CCFEE 6388]
MSGIKVVPYSTLEEQWHVPGAREPGFMRWLKSWVGGPAGYVNPNKQAAVINENFVVGMMNLFKGQQQKGLHYHSVTEIYVILTGELESYDGKGEKTYAGPMDCIYIPAGVPHGVRNSGDSDCELIWVHDGIEKIGTSVYYMDGIVTGPPQVDIISMARWTDLQHHINAPMGDRDGFSPNLVSWVAGSAPGQLNYNRDIAVPSDKVAIGMTCLKAGQSVPLLKGGVGYCYVVMDGAATFKGGQKEDDAAQRVTRLDGVWVPKGTPHKVTNHGQRDLQLMWVQEFPEQIKSLEYLEN